MMEQSAIFPEARIFVAGHRGLVGSALVRKLRSAGFHNLLLTGREELDLTCQSAVRSFFAKNKPDYVFLAAGRVGGIFANNEYPAEFLQENLLILSNVIDTSYRTGVSKLLFLGSSCIYPKHAPQPITEDALLTGPLEATNEWYAVAKIAGLKACQAYRRQYGFNAISAMPTNLYGPGDHFDLNNSHVLPALIRKVHEAKQKDSDAVVVWGSGTPRREFLYVDDLAEACLFLMQNYDDQLWINVGYGADQTIADLAHVICRVVGYRGAVRFDASKPDGTPRKLLDSNRLITLGWKPTVSLEEGIRRTYAWFLENPTLASGSKSPTSATSML